MTKVGVEIAESDMSRHHRDKVAAEVEMMVRSDIFPPVGRIKAIAKATGYSVASVSRFLNGRHPTPAAFVEALRGALGEDRIETFDEKLHNYLMSNLRFNVKHLRTGKTKINLSLRGQKIDEIIL